MTAALPPQKPVGQETRPGPSLPSSAVQAALRDLASLAARVGGVPWSSIRLGRVPEEHVLEPELSSETGDQPAAPAFIESLPIHDPDGPSGARPPLGRLVLADRAPREFSADCIALLTGLARQAGALLSLDAKARDAREAALGNAAAMAPTAAESANHHAEIAPHFKIFLDHLPSTAFIKDESGRYVFANRALWKAYTGSAEEGDPRTIDETRRLTPESVETVRRNDRTVMETGRTLEAVEKLAYDGAEHYWWVCKFPITDDRGRRLMGGITLEVTDLEKARAETRLFEHVFRNIQVGVKIWKLEDPADAGSFRLLAVNAAASRMMIVPAEKALGRTMRETYPMLLEMGIAEKYRSVLVTGEPVDLGEVAAGGEGSEKHWFSAKVFPLPDNCVGVAFEDVSGQRRMRDRLGASLERFELIAKASNDGLWEADVQANEAWWNDRMFEILGYAPGSIKPSQEAWNARLHPEDRERAVLAVRQSMGGGGDSWTREYRVLWPDGEVRHVYARGIVSRGEGGRPLRILGSVTDITEVKKTEEALRENEERYRKLVEVLPDVVAISFDGILEFINPAGLEFRKTDSMESMLGRHILEFFHPDDRPAVVERQKKLAAGMAVPPIQFRFLRADGTTVEAESRAIPFPYKGRNANMVVIRDITERKRAEEALQRSEEHYRLLFHGSPQPMYLADTETLRFLDVNRAAELQYGYSREEFLTLTLRDIRPPEDVAFLEKQIRNLGDVWGNKGIWRQRRKDGSIIQAEIIAHPLESHKNPNASLAIALDVTEKLIAVEKLRHSEERYRTLARVSPVGLFRTDSKGFCTYVNEHGFLITGLPANRLEGHGWIGCLHPDDKDRVWAEWERTLSLDTPFEAEYRFLKPDGKVVWVLGRAQTDRGPEGEIIGYVGTFTDITERKQAETLLAGQKRTLAMIASGWSLGDVLDSLLHYAEKECPGMAAGILLLDGDPRRFHWASAPSLPDAVRHAYEGAQPSEESGPVGSAAAVRRLSISADTASHEGWTRGRAEAAESGYRSCAALPILGSYGGLLGSIAFFFEADGDPAPFDIKLLEVASDLAAIAVERWRQEETGRLNQELSEENRRILEANRMKSEFMASMSHELRTPLNAIIGFSQLLIDRKVGALNDKQAEYLGDILDGGMHLLRLINDVLDLAKIESGKMQLFPEPVSVPRAIREVCDILMPMALSKGIAFRIDAERAPGEVIMDSQKFKQVLYNLVSNAIKFSGQGSPVSIAAELGAAGELRLQVTDRGIGIRKEDLGKLFQEFQQLDSGAARHFPGTGLGLVITKKLVELHRGTVGVESEAGRGSTFHATFPALPEAEE